MTNHLTVTPEVCAALGMTQEAVAKLTLSQFSMLIFAKGYDVRVKAFDVPSEDGAGRLTIKMDA